MKLSNISLILYGVGGFILSLLLSTFAFLSPSEWNIGFACTYLVLGALVLIFGILSFFKGRIFKILMASAGLASLLLYLAYMGYSGFRAAQYGQAYFGIAQDSIKNIQSLVTKISEMDAIQSINPITGEVDLSNLKSSGERQVIEVLNEIALNPSYTSMETKDAIQNMKDLPVIPLKDYETEAIRCKNSKILPEFEDNVLQGYSELFGYPLYSGFAEHGLYCTFTTGSLSDVGSWPISCLKDCGYKHLNVGQDLGALKPAAVDGMVKYVEALKELSKTDQELCICYSAFTSAYLSADYRSFIYFAFTIAFLGVGLFSCLLAFAIPVKALISSCSG